MIPEKITAGDTQTWTYDKFTDKDNVEVTSDIWDLAFYFRKAGAAVSDLITVAGTANVKGGWDFEHAFADDLAGGTYYFSVKATYIADPTIIATVTKGQLKGEASITGTGSYDGRSQARQDLEAVQTAIRALVSGGAVQEYTINHRSFRKMTLEELRNHEAALKIQVVKEEKAEAVKQGKGDPNNLFVRFK